MVQRLYEAMYVVDSNLARENYEAMEEVVHTSITRHGGEIVKSMKWDDRRMTFEMKKVKRGVYILVHFNAETSAIVKIERQAQLSEKILRVLVTVDEDGIETETGSARERAEEQTRPPSESRGRGGRPPRGGDRPGGRGNASAGREGSRSRANDESDGEVSE